MACPEGCSSRKGVLTLSRGMGRDQVLAAMNKPGHAQRSAFHWHHQLLSGCVLEVHARRFLGSLEPQQVSIRGAGVCKNWTPDKGDFTVMLVPRSAVTMGTVVLDRLDAVDASRRVWLLNDRPRFCSAEPGNRS